MLGLAELALVLGAMFGAGLFRLRPRPPSTATAVATPTYTPTPVPTSTPTPTPIPTPTPQPDDGDGEDDEEEEEDGETIWQTIIQTIIFPFEKLAEGVRNASCPHWRGCEASCPRRRRSDRPSGTVPRRPLPERSSAPGSAQSPARSSAVAFPASDRAALADASGDPRSGGKPGPTARATVHPSRPSAPAKYRKFIDDGRDSPVR